MSISADSFERVEVNNNECQLQQRMLEAKKINQKEARATEL